MLIYCLEINNLRATFHLKFESFVITKKVSQFGDINVLGHHVS